jgi:Rieske Fe-S protein
MGSSDVFSIETAVGRREFLKRTGLVLGAASLTGMLSEILASCSSLTGPSVQHGTTTVNIASLTSDGQFIVDSSVTPDGTPILVIRQNATTYTALSMLCTHQGCQVNSPSSGQIYCSCHGSVFDLHGNVLAGPAPSPLAKYGVTLNAAAKTVTVTY